MPSGGENLSSITISVCSDVARLAASAMRVASTPPDVMATLAPE